MAPSLKNRLKGVHETPRASLTDIISALGSTAGVGGEFVKLGGLPPRVPEQDEGEYITFLAHVRAGLNFPISRFTAAVLDSYGI